MSKCDYGNEECGRIGHDCAFCYVTSQQLCNSCENTYPECGSTNVKFGCDVDTPQRLRENRDNIFYCDKYRERKKKITNADRIRTMSDEELNKFMSGCELGDIDYSVTFCDLCKKDGNRLGLDCNGCRLHWLQSEVEG